jgi:phytoene dehydrogenase-like protein
MADHQHYDAIVVGAGIAGLTAAAYLARAGHRTLLCEKEDTCGGLVSTFKRDGFVFDGGIRAIENSGIVFPMLKELGVELEFVPSPVSIGIEDRIIRLTSVTGLKDYEVLLEGLFPEDRDGIAAIMEQVRRAMGYMDVLYGIDNPAFMDVQSDPAYAIKVLLPWLPRYLVAMRKVGALSGPIVPYLERYAHNQSLVDIIAQHFFRSTPAFFALSYFSLYLDYRYPRGGTGKLTEALATFVKDRGGEIRTGTEIVSVDPEGRQLTDANGQRYGYRRLVWAADLRALYGHMRAEDIQDDRMRRAVLERKAAVADKTGGDSVYTVYLSLDLDKSYFEERASAHLFYTASRQGQSAVGGYPVGEHRQAIEAWLAQFLRLTTYEISCPVMRDDALAPPGKTGLIVSMLFDHALVEQIEAEGWYDAFKAQCEETILDVLDGSVFPGIKDAVIDRFSSTPLSIAERVGSTGGAITGWAFTNKSIPVEHGLPKILRAVRTPIDGVFQAGQWAFSPSGLPTSILTGKLAADAVTKGLKRGG